MGQVQRDMGQMVAVLLADTGMARLDMGQMVAVLLPDTGMARLDMGQQGQDTGLAHLDMGQGIHPWVAGLQLVELQQYIIIRLSVHSL